MFFTLHSRLKTWHSVKGVVRMKSSSPFCHAVFVRSLHILRTDLNIVALTSLNYIFLCTVTRTGECGTMVTETPLTFFSHQIILDSGRRVRKCFTTENLMFCYGQAQTVLLPHNLLLASVSSKDSSSQLWSVWCRFRRIAKWTSLYHMLVKVINFSRNVKVSRSLLELCRRHVVMLQMKVLQVASVQQLVDNFLKSFTICIFV